jgi:predicted O-methyltransferase YrrM
VTVELDEERAAAVADLFSADENVRVLRGDWRAVMPREAPFDLLFYDGGGKQRPDVDGAEVVGLLAPRGVVVMDDLTPGRPRAGDPVREFWLGHADLAAVELTLSPSMAAIVAVRVR